MRLASLLWSENRGIVRWSLWRLSSPLVGYRLTRRGGTEALPVSFVLTLERGPISRIIDRMVPQLVTNDFEYEPLTATSFDRMSVEPAWFRHGAAKFERSAV